MNWNLHVASQVLWMTVRFLSAIHIIAILRFEVAPTCTVLIGYNLRVQILKATSGYCKLSLFNFSVSPLTRKCVVWISRLAKTHIPLCYSNSQISQLCCLLWVFYLSSKFSHSCFWAKEQILIGLWTWTLLCTVNVHTTKSKCYCYVYFITDMCSSWHRD